MEPEQIEMEALVRLLDQALTSKNPMLQKALRELLLITALSEEPVEKGKGPLSSMDDQIKDLRLRLSMLEASLVQISAELKYYRTGPDTYKTYQPITPTYPYYPPVYDDKTSSPWKGYPPNTFWNGTTFKEIMSAGNKIIPGTTNV
jgi:hypothetical protein